MRNVCCKSWLATWLTANGFLVLIKVKLKYISFRKWNSENIFKLYEMEISKPARDYQSDYLFNFICICIICTNIYIAYLTYTWHISYIYLVYVFYNFNVGNYMWNLLLVCYTFLFDCTSQCLNWSKWCRFFIYMLWKGILNVYLMSQNDSWNLLGFCIILPYGMKNVKVLNQAKKWTCIKVTRNFPSLFSVWLWNPTYL